MALFDAYVMVDWSAAATPRYGSDSIWISLAERGANGLADQALVNPSTRAEAVAWLADRLSDLTARGRTSLLGFYAPGAVGSQTLLGIPRVLELRDRPWLQDHLRVWPFETGLARLERPAPGGIVAAEVYPSLIDADPAPVRDAGQVGALTRHFAQLDDAGHLGDLFAGDPALGPRERQVVETEEGWILGVRNSLKAHRTPRPLAGEGQSQIIQDPAEIYRQSFAIIRREADLSRFSGPMEDLAIRIVHACGMPDVAALLAFRSGAAEAGCRALAQGNPILVDAQMVAHGIIRRRLPAGNPVLCLLDDPGVPALAEGRATTRSAAAVRLWADRLEGAVVAIGNAPTALFELLAMLAEGAPRPALILGFPVGFVGAAESKQALIVSDLPYIALPGRRGGSAMAAAAVNALAGDAS